MISPTKVGAQLFRHQLRVKTRSMKFRVLPHQLQAKARSVGGGILTFRTHSQSQIKVAKTNLIAVV